ncbi:MAG: hypothetical protein M3362_16685, partial [Acidobacteriota bacterium]|nr:hypothetical protein [Acidobacteriota bacterium]
MWRKRNFPIEKRVIITVDCSSILPFSPDRFRQEILLELREQTLGAMELTGSILDLAYASNVTIRDLRRLLVSLGRRGISLVLMIDEFDVALQPHETYSEAEMISFLHELRSIAHSTEGQYFSSVVVMRRKPTEILLPLPAPPPGSVLNSASSSLTSSFLASPWYNHYFLVPLKLFDEAETRSL